MTYNTSLVQIPLLFQHTEIYKADCSNHLLNIVAKKQEQKGEKHSYAPLLREKSLPLLIKCDTLTRSV